MLTKIRNAVRAQSATQTWFNHDVKLRQMSLQRISKYVMIHSMHSIEFWDGCWCPYSNCSELKRRMKAEQKAKEKTEKEATLPEKTEDPAKSAQTKNVKEEEINSCVTNKTIQDNTT